jgi:hypothetical protein
MTRENARLAANAVLVAAGVAAAYVVLTRPPLRRLAARAARLWLRALPAYLIETTSRAWVESGRAA